MNPLQKAWLKVLTPLAYVINEKMAKRNGLIGKIGRFFAIGPREYGVHPTTKYFAAFNRRFIYAQGLALHRMSSIKSLTGKGHSLIRPMKHLSIFPMMAGLSMLAFTFFYGANNQGTQ